MSDMAPRSGSQDGDRHPLVSYAQNAEDVVLARALRPTERNGFWIDVGAGDPVGDSVTAHFSSLGWRGINIEPLPDEYSRLCAARPDDINLQVAVSDEPGKGTLYAGPPDNRGMSTLDAELGEQYLTEGFVAVEVSVVTLADIVAEYVDGPVDFLKVDVEGFETAVLAGIDFTTLRPTVIVVEATEPGTSIQTHQAWEGILLAEGYTCTLFDGLNRFYASADAAPEVVEALRVPANVLDDFVPYRWSSQLEGAIEAIESAHQEIAKVHLAWVDERTNLEQQLLLERERVRIARVDLEAAEARCSDALSIAARVPTLEAELAAVTSRRGYRFMDGVARRVHRSPVLTRLVDGVLRVGARSGPGT